MSTLWSGLSSPGLSPLILLSAPLRPPFRLLSLPPSRSSSDPREGERFAARTTPLYFSPLARLFLRLVAIARCPKLCCSLQSHCLSSVVSFCVCTSFRPALPTAAVSPHRPGPSWSLRARDESAVVLHLLCFFSGGEKERGQFADLAEKKRERGGEEGRRNA